MSKIAHVWKPWVETKLLTFSHRSQWTWRGEGNWQVHPEEWWWSLCCIMKKLKIYHHEPNQNSWRKYVFHKPLTQLRSAVPEHGKGFVAATGDQRHLNALASNLITVQATNGTYGLLQGQHLDCGLQLIVCVGAKLHSFHLDKTSHTISRCFDTRVNLISHRKFLLQAFHLKRLCSSGLECIDQIRLYLLHIHQYNNIAGVCLTRPYLEKVSCSVCCRSLRDIL